MDWETLYQSRVMSAEAAVTRIQSGDRVVVGHAVGEPTHIIEAMVQNYRAYKDVEIAHMVQMGAAGYVAPGMEPHFRHTAIFVGGKTRETVKSGHGDYLPCFFHRVPELFRTDLPVDVALIQVTPPDAHGYCSLGVSVDYTKPAAECAKLVIAQVNRNMPRTLGDSFLHVSQIHCFVEHDAPVIELAAPTLTQVEKDIGAHCAQLVQDGDCLQLGIGAIPDAVLLSLKDKKDLGIHSEMISSGVAELMACGVITNRRKNFHPGKAIITFLMGSQKLYDFVNNNPAIEMHPVDYVNDPFVAGRNDNLVSINSCVQVDFLGQVCAETVGQVQISGVGGQVDFVRAAAVSRGGRSIIAMPSTAAGGKVSKIVPMLDPGAAVTTSRNDVDYVVTEYGIARLRNRTNRARARALIQIAHPEWRPKLIEEFETRFRANYIDGD